MFGWFSDFVTISCLVFVCGIPALINIILYPISKPLCVRYSRYIQNRIAPLVFAVLNKYKNFRVEGEIQEGLELPEQFLLISNHQALLDIPIYMKVLHGKELRFVAKAELGRHVPLASEMLRAEEHCLVPRTGSPSVSMQNLEKFGKRVVERNQIPVLFPEGTRSKTGALGTFYAAAFRKLTDSTNLPVCVCALDGGYKIGNINRMLSCLNDGVYHVKVLGVFPAPHGKEEQTALLEKAKSMIQAQLDEWRK